MMSLLPARLSAALAALADGKGRTALSLRSRAISKTYQNRGNSSSALFTADDALAYALARMPATFAATKAALERLLEARPNLAPESLLDVGCGPGTACFAAEQVFPSLRTAVLLDRNGPFLDLARTLAAKTSGDLTTTITARDLDRDTALPKADLVIASYVLAELAPRHQVELTNRLWQATSDTLLLVEPGTPDGHARLMAARQALVAAGCHVVAPCTHAAPCPMVQSGDTQRWCRFFERVQRSRDHKLLKAGDRPFEDEPYSYLAVSRHASQTSFNHRIVSRPAETKVGITLELCGQEGIGTNLFPSRSREIFKQVKRLRAGDAVLIPIQAPQAPDEA